MKVKFIGIDENDTAEAWRSPSGAEWDSPSVRIPTASFSRIWRGAGPATDDLHQRQRRHRLPPVRVGDLRDDSPDLGPPHHVDLNTAAARQANGEGHGSGGVVAMTPLGTGSDAHPRRAGRLGVSSQVPRPTTGLPARSARAISERVPNSPPTATTASALATTMAFRASPRPVATAMSTWRLAASAVRAGKDADRRTPARLCSPARRFHHAAEPAADEDRSRFGDLAIPPSRRASFCSSVASPDPITAT